MEKPGTNPVKGGGTRRTWRGSKKPGKPQRGKKKKRTPGVKAPEAHMHDLPRGSTGGGSHEKASRKGGTE